MTDYQRAVLVALARYVMHKNGSTADLNRALTLEQAEFEDRLCVHGLPDDEKCEGCGRTVNAEVDFDATP